MTKCEYIRLIANLIFEKLCCYQVTDDGTWCSATYYQGGLQNTVLRVNLTEGGVFVQYHVAPDRDYLEYMVSVIDLTQYFGTDLNNSSALDKDALATLIAFDITLLTGNFSNCWEPAVKIALKHIFTKTNCWMGSGYCLELDKLNISSVLKNNTIEVTVKNEAQGVLPFYLYFSDEAETQGQLPKKESTKWQVSYKGADSC